MFDDGNLDRVGRTRLHTCWSFADGESRVAHVALAHDTARLGILWHFIRTHHHAVLAADALVIEMTNNTGDRILVVGQHRTTIQTARVNAMMACGRYVLLKCRCASTCSIIPGRITHEQTHPAPGFVLIKSVQSVTCADAGFAPGTFVEINFKGVLLAGSRRRSGEQIAVKLTTNSMLIVRTGKLFHRVQLLLLGQQFVNQRARRIALGARYWRQIRHRVSSG